MSRSSPLRPALLLGTAVLVISALASKASEEQHTTITLPAAASIVGVSPFFSDVRLFNTSYTDDLLVTARYRCFLGSCGGGSPVLHPTTNSRTSPEPNEWRIRPPA